VIQNTTDKLVNYELRRKMRKVTVQVQDIGTSLCWHTFVDDAGRDLGIAKLVHIGQPPDLSDLVQPDAPPIPTAQMQEVSISIPFVGLDTDDTGNAYTDGTETVRSIFDVDKMLYFVAPGMVGAAPAPQRAAARSGAGYEAGRSCRGRSRLHGRQGLTGLRRSGRETPRRGVHVRQRSPRHVDHPREHRRLGRR